MIPRSIRSIKTLIPEKHPLRLGWHRLRAFFAALRCGFPARKLTVIAVTGTDGKTTTVSMITHILLKAGKKAGAASTAFLQINDRREENASHLTSISPGVLQRFLTKLVNERCEFAVLEMSSHGLVQGRSSWTWPSVSAITNTAPEHLDYHGTFEQYRRDKGRIFTMLRGRGTKVLNGNDGSFDLYRAIPSEKTIVYGPETSDMHLSDIRANSQSCSATLNTGKETFSLQLGLPGTFNLENALCAISCASAVGISVDTCVEALRSFQPVPGRMEKIDEGQDFSVYVDFAVTPQAYEKTLRTLRLVVGEKGRVLVLCSSCGNRMREKRPDIGKICSELADVVVLTEDETYGEDPIAVMEEVWKGMDLTKTDARKIPDRREAIKTLLSLAKKGDAVVLCGMGPFSTMTTLKGRIPWDERKIAKDILHELQPQL